MISDPVISIALLGTARMSQRPPVPDPCLEEIWKILDWEKPATAILSALALLRTMHRAGTQTIESRAESHPCPPEQIDYLPAAGVDLAVRLLSGEFPEVLPEWMQLAIATNRILPPRVLPDLLDAATKQQALRNAASRLAGERGRWLARRRPEFSWLIEGTVVAADAWDTGTPAERIASLRHILADDPSTAAEIITNHWTGEDAAIREKIVNLVAEHPQPCDEAWLQTLALADRRQEIRDLAAVALMKIPHSAFRTRALARMSACVKVERRLLKRIITITPPDSFDAAWAADGLKAKPPHGIGEKAWWLRQMIGQFPLNDWPEMLGSKGEELFSLSREKDWEDTLLAGWIESASRFPDRAICEHFLPFIAKQEPWPAGVTPRTQLLQTLLEAMPSASRNAMLDQLAKILPPPSALDLLTRCTGCGIELTEGSAMMSVIEAQLAEKTSFHNRPQARALATNIPAAQIQSFLERLAKLPEISSTTEEFATVLEFRRTLHQHFTK